jgi:hypothetical protein
MYTVETCSLAGMRKRYRRIPGNRQVKKYLAVQ